jgi:glycosyltransferase involved in cell wall biosynthesis
MADNSNKIIVLVDITVLFDQYSRRGIGIYAKNVLLGLIEKFIESETHELVLFGFNNKDQNLMEIGFSTFRIEEIRERIKFESLGEPTSSSFRNIINWKKQYQQIINKINPDIFYAFHFERGLPTVPHFSKQLNSIPKTIVVAHDAIPLVTNKFSAKGTLHNMAKKWFYKFMWEGIQYADTVITASEFSKQDLIKFGEIDEAKIHVVYLGVDDKFKRDKQGDDVQEILDNYQLNEKKYFFYDSGIESNKGSNELLEIFSRIVKLNDETLPKYLVITGKDFEKGIGEEIKPRTIHGDKFIRKAKRLGILDNIVTTDKITDKHLLSILFNADVYINLSQYEGFGLGPIQAMKAEIPTIIYNGSCFPEVTSGGAFLIDIDKKQSGEYNFEQSVDKIVKFLKDKKQVQEYIKLGRKVASKYTWDNTVDKTWNLITSINR